MTTATKTPTTSEMKEALASLWWMPLIRGILLILFGILMFTQPGATLLSLLWFMGIYWIVDGLFSLIEGVRGHPEKSRIWMFLSGIVSLRRRNILPLATFSAVYFQGPPSWR